MPMMFPDIGRYTEMHMLSVPEKEKGVPAGPLFDPAERSTEQGGCLRICMSEG